MTKERLYLFDTTLRDGAQTQGVDFSVEDKRLIAGLLDKLGIDYVEGGYPGANPTDTNFFAEDPGLKRATFTAFGMTKRAGRSADNDPGLAAIFDSTAKACCFVAKSWDFQVDVALGITKEENIDSIADTVATSVRRGRETMIDAEHFFDGYKANPDFALACLKAAIDNGARWAVLCDTNGGTLPHEIERIVGEVTQHIPGDKLGIHTHNDTENAVANSLAAIRAGVRQVQGTLNGLGERCGNANMVSLIPTLLLKPEFADKFEIGVSLDQLKEITHVSRTLDELLNRAPHRYAPYVGESAFASKAGIHVSALLKDPTTYEHVPPESVGNKRRILVSDQSGRSNVLAQLEAAGIDVDAKDPRVQQLLDEVKEREYLGYSYDGAEASFELLARRALGTVPDYFNVESFRVLVERRYNALGKRVTVSEATVKLVIDGKSFLSAGEGNGPVNALAQALTKDLGRYQPYVDELTLVDFKVRILTGGTEAVTRVLIETADKKTGERWFTVGVSENIVDAAFQAFLDSITYKLMCDGAPAPEAKRKPTLKAPASSS
ncbi:citramalate synthase [Tepidicaulis sp. LMO-SS28]|uniref:citramalate synthase n=1 Tax=Tepidicaulis sp. LMO-SS28 TaxID=3447455 RepID=UPI003EE342B8